MFVPMDEVGADGLSVLEGREGWLFLDRVGDVDVLGLYTREDGLDEATSRAWADALRRRRELFQREGIVYQTLVVPESPAVYRDKLPEDVHLAGQTPFERLLDTLDDETRAQCVYPLGELVAGRDLRDSFSPHDAAWTDWGAWLGYRASIEALTGSLPGLRVLDESDLDWSERPVVGPLATALGPGDLRLQPTATVRRPRSRVTITVSTEADDTLLIVEQDAPDLPTAVVFRDALLNAPAKFFTESFRRTTFVSTPNVVYHDLVAWERPDVVIHELAESRLVVPPYEPSTVDFRAAFGDLMLEDSVAIADQRRSRSLARVGRVEEALAASDDVLARVLPTARLMLHRARLHLQAGQTAAAVEALRHATTLDASDGAPWSLLGQVLAGTPGREREGALAHARAARAEPEQSVYWQLAISAALRTDDLRLAEELRREALTRHADDARLANAASWVLAATGRLEEAEQAAEFAAQAQPGTIDHLWQLASIQIRRGRLQDAGHTMTQLWRLKPDDPDVQHYLEVLRRATAPQTAMAEGLHEGQR